MKKIILASSSHWRKELLKRARVSFDVEVSSYVENMRGATDPEALVRELAEGKARAVALSHSDAIVIGADTVITHKGTILGKPSDAAEATKVLMAFSGTDGYAYTGVCVIDSATGHAEVFCEKTRFVFRAITDGEIDAYVATGEPLGVAGSFGIQGGAASFIERIEGDFYNIVGLPLSKTVEALRKFIPIA
jgi:septum formation protein